MKDLNFPQLPALVARTPLLWINPRWSPIAEMTGLSSLSLADVREAACHFERFAGLLAELFPELVPSAGQIESPLRPADLLQREIMSQATGRAGRWLLKCDHELPVAGSIKARGGVYEVLLHAESLAIRNGVLLQQQDRGRLASEKARALFSSHTVAVGSTGNLGLSIGIVAAALGFRAVVHMSADAKSWKKERLRRRGVEVVEHPGDFGSAVAAGREQARRDPRAYFVDDENSPHLFLGYSVAALSLQQQLTALGIVVDARHPLFVYLPCGVGGAAGGITFGLRQLLGDHVHCFFAEPVASPAMLVRLALAQDRAISVRDIGLDNQTEADGLAVAQASEFVAPIMRPLVSGVFTVSDEQLFNDLYLLEQTEGLHIEPSAAAGFRGPRWLLESAPGAQYLRTHGLLEFQASATHVLWTTGGALVPAEEYRGFCARGREIHGARHAR